MAAPDTSTAPTGPLQIVLDTNVVLDWLVFAEPHASRVGDAIRGGSLHWVRTAAMASELERVLAYEQIRRYDPDTTFVLAEAARCSTLIDPPPPLPLPRRIRCTDADDQGFIDLALTHTIPWLLSRDRAVLRLARRAARQGVRIAPPARWPSS